MQNKPQEFTALDKQCLLALPKENSLSSMPLNDAIKEAQRYQADYWPYWITRGYVDNHDLAQALAQISHLPYLKEPQHSFTYLKKLNQTFDMFFQVDPKTLVVHHDAQSITIAIYTPRALNSINQLSLQMETCVKFVILPYQICEKLIWSLLFDRAQQALQYNEKHHHDHAISEYCQLLFMDAITKGVSDIHGEPGLVEFHIRYRMDGLLQRCCHFDSIISRNLTNRLKVLSQRDLATTRLPQDGHLTIVGHPRGTRDARINFCPTIYGEKWVIRLLNTQQKTLHLRHLDLKEPSMQRLDHAIHQPQGLILVTGPTGSGKTTTLYALLETLNKPEVNISTIEDPVEQHLNQINQIEINANIGLTFATGLRALLRQDPDILMIGEIRDHETARIALNAAQTGHLVFATLHSNSTAHTISRLLSMGFHPEQLSSTLLCIIAQRLVRLRCRQCSHDDTAKICTTCHTGYHGRMALYELMPIDKTLKRIIETMPFNIEALEHKACQQGMETLSDAGAFLIEQGLTDQKEIERVLCH